MRLSAIIGGEERQLEVRDLGEGRYRVEYQGRVFVVDALPMEAPTWSLLIEGQSFDADLLPGKGDKLMVRLRGGAYPVEVLDERRMRMRRAAGAFEVEGRATVDSPMPGKVVKVLVAEGDEVEEGQGVVVVEAMKMENELKAPKAGTVVELSASEGQLVEGGAVLVVIE